MKAFRPYGALGTVGRVAIIMVGLQVLTETAARLLWPAVVATVAVAAGVVGGRQVIIWHRGWPG